MQLYDTIRDAILTCARKLTWVGLIYRTETTTKNCKAEKLKSKSRYVRSNSKSLGNHVVSYEEEKERLEKGLLNVCVCVRACVRVCVCVYSRDCCMAKFHLADLAGSEQLNRTKSEGKQLTEERCIYCLSNESARSYMTKLCLCKYAPFINMDYGRRWRAVLTVDRAVCRTIINYLISGLFMFCKLFTLHFIKQ